MAANREVVLLTTHFLDDRIVAMYRRLAEEAGDGRDVAVLFNRSDDANPGYRPPADMDLFAFTEKDIRGLGYPYKGRRLTDTDIELFTFPFHRAHPEYARVWVTEYDVDFTGPWSDIFDAFGQSDSPLIATNVHRWHINPAWENWATVRTPEGRPDPRGLLRAFLPFYRLGEDAYAALDEAYRFGWRGHYECVLPSVIERAGLPIEDFGGDGEFVAPGNRYRFYVSTPENSDLSPGSFVFRPVMTSVGDRPGTLWHPVKPPSHMQGWHTGRRAMLSRRMRKLARTGVSSLSLLLDRWRTVKSLPRQA